jgi:hypothetical protein
MNVTPLRAITLAGLLLAALCVQSSTAVALGPTAPEISSARAALNAAPSASPARQVVVVHGPAKESSRTFDWKDASVGAGVTAVIGLLIFGGASLFGRRRLRGRLPAS